jgi:hypothetical protein
MKVLIAFQYFWLKAFRIYEVVLSFIEVGCGVIFLIGQLFYPQGKAFTGDRATSFRPEQHAAGCSIYLVPLASPWGVGVLTLVANYLSFAFSASIFGPWLLRNKCCDINFTDAPSPVKQAIPALWFAFFRQAKLVTRVYVLVIMLGAAEFLLSHAYVRMMFVSGVSRIKWLQLEVERWQLGNVQLTGRFATEALQGILDRASVITASLLRSFNMSHSVLSKVLRAGKLIMRCLTVGTLECFKNQALVCSALRKMPSRWPRQCCGSGLCFPMSYNAWARPI